MEPNESTLEAANEAQRPLAFAGFEFDPDQRILRRNGDEVALPPRALHTLAALLAEPGRLIAKEELLEAVWGDRFVSEGVLKEVVFLLRKTFGDDAQAPRFIQTVHRRGYRFVGEVDRPAGGSAPREGTSDRPAAAWPLAFGILGLFVASLVLVIGREEPAPPITARLTVAIPQSQQIVPAGLAVSRDGESLVYVGKTDARRLYLRHLDRSEPIAIGGSEGGRHPFFSPDGRQIGFFAQGELRIVSVDGGVPRTVAAAEDGGGGAWVDDDTIVYSGGPGEGLYRASLRSASIRKLSRPDFAHGETAHLWPEALPGGERLLFTAWHSSIETSAISALDLDSGAIESLIESASFPRWAEPGQLLFARPGEILTVGLSRADLTPQGAPRRVLHDVDIHSRHGAAALALSPSGTLAYLPASQSDRQQALSWLTPDGTRRPIPVPAGRYAEARLSPDGRFAALTAATEAGSDVWIADLTTGSAAPLTTGGSSGFAVWAPGGDELVHATLRGAETQLRSTDRHGEASRDLPSPGGLVLPRSVTLDGRVLLARREPTGGSSAWSLDLRSDEQASLLAAGDGRRETSWSPDGRWIAYSRVSGDRSELFVSRVERPLQQWQVAGEGGTAPMWSPDSHRLYFRRGSQLLSLALDNDGAPAERSHVVLDGLDPAASLQPAPGEPLRFLELAPASLSAPQRIELIVGWSPEVATAHPPGT